MDKIRKLMLSTFVLAISLQMVTAQLTSWEGIPEKEEAENAHSIYRQAIKSGDMAIAFENWQIAYNLAPTADGKRDYHFIDGVKLYIDKFKNETDPAKKEEHKAMIDKLYGEAITAYETKAIKPSNCNDDACYQAKVGYVLGRKAFDMFYTLNSPYSKNLEVLEQAVEKSGNDTEYTVFDPLATIAVYQFQKGKIDKLKALDIYQKMEAITQHNIDSGAKYADYYDQAWKSASSKYAPIEADIFDCEFFKPKYKEMYDSAPDDMDQLKNIVGLLKKRGCDPSDPLLVDLEGKWKSYAASTNAARKAEFEANNPSLLAKKAYDSGDYAGAIAKYDEAINGATDPSKKASYMFSKASIQGRKLKKYSAARKTALAATKVNPSSGRPYMLIGDLYATGARDCGDSWNQRLAIIAAIDKYRKAKSVDPSVADEAKNKISKYRSSLPDQQEGFMRSVKAGDTQKVGCWIGETVTVRYK